MILRWLVLATEGNGFLFYLMDFHQTEMTYKALREFTCKIDSLKSIVRSVGFFRSNFE